MVDGLGLVQGLVQDPAASHVAGRDLDHRDGKQRSKQI